MPIYEYSCPSCGVIEAWQGINDSPLKSCPNCHSRKLRKLISESSFHLKGSGWYATDYGNGKNGKPKAKDPDAAQSSSAKEADSATKSSTSSESSKPAESSAKSTDSSAASSSSAH